MKEYETRAQLIAFWCLFAFVNAIFLGQSAPNKKSLKYSRIPYLSSDEWNCDVVFKMDCGWGNSNVA